MTEVRPTTPAAATELVLSEMMMAAVDLISSVVPMIGTPVNITAATANGTAVATATTSTTGSMSMTDGPAMRLTKAL